MDERVRRRSLPASEGFGIKRKGAIRRKTFAIFVFNSISQVNITSIIYIRYKNLINNATKRYMPLVDRLNKYLF